jgi:hypothetical protein
VFSEKGEIEINQASLTISTSRDSPPPSLSIFIVILFSNFPYDSFPVISSCSILPSFELKETPVLKFISSEADIGIWVGI